MLNQSVERQLFRQLKEDESLKSLLSGVSADQFTVDQLKNMHMWTRPLISSDNPDTIKARNNLCFIDGIQAQGLLRNCSGYV